MKYTFIVEYDSDKDSFEVLNSSNNVILQHSGSSYLRLLPENESFYGTVGTYHDTSCYEGGLNIDAPLRCNGRHLQFFITKAK